MTRQDGEGFADTPAARLEVVGELASLINTTFDLDEIFPAAILKLARVLPFRRASVVLISDDRTHYYLHTLYDKHDGGFVPAAGSYPVGHGLTGRALLEGEAIRVDEFGGTDGIRSPGERNVSALLVPLRVGGDVIGTLNLGADEPGAYRDEDLELAILLGRQIATSLYYSRLLATIQEQREALATEHDHVQSERARLEALIEASDAAILMASGGRVAYANGSMAALLGLPREALVGAELEGVLRVLAGHLADPQALEPQRRAMRSGASTLRDRVELVFPQRMVCQRTVTPVRSADGADIGHLLIYRDVTREAEAEAAKTEFVSLVSHELRTPLTSVKTSLGLLLRGAAGAVSGSARELLEIALRNLDRLIRLVDDLLDLARIESGRVVTRLVPVSLNDATARALDALRAFAEERSVTVRHEESDAATVVLADSDRLQQIIVNLLSNAIKFSPQGGVVRLGWRMQGEQAVMEIADGGAGIPADQLESIFDKFRQLDRSDKRQHGGAGLGLAISRTIARQMGGDLWAESDEGRGSRFFLRLRTVQERPRERRPPGDAVAAGHSVLVVESDPDLARLLQAQFERERWEARIVASAEEAMTALADGSVDLVTVAVELEDMHGLEFLRRLRDSPIAVDTPALLVGPGADAAQASEFGADGWVVGDPDSLIAEAKRLASAPRRPIILVVEDDPAVRRTIARGLRRAGYACLETASADEGLAAARERAPRLALIDRQLPGQDGIGLLEEMRGDPDLSDVPAIVMTGRSKAETVRAMRGLGAEFIAKPFSMDNILRAIDRLVGSR